MIIHLDIHDHSDIPIQITKDDFKELLKFLDSTKDKSISYIHKNNWRIIHMESNIVNAEDGCSANETELKPMGLDAF